MIIKDKQANNSIRNQADYMRILPNANLSVNPFGQNKVAEIAYKRIEKLVLATYLITNFVPTSENVRENVRENVQELLPLTLDFRSGLHSAGPDVIDSVIAKVRHILSLLDVIHASGYISNMNLEVLKNAYTEFINFIIKSKDEIASENIELSEEHFMPKVANSKGQKHNGQTENITDKNITDILKDNLSSENVKDKEQETTTRNKSISTKRRASARRMAILDVVTRHSPIHTKDIAMEITNWSEKTIQRELLSLVDDGILKKEGMKRWTVYSIVS